MSETAKTYTAREMVMARRLGFVDGATFEMRAWQRLMHVTHCSGADPIEVARQRYPLTKITRLRVRQDPLEWRVRWSVSDDRIVGEAVDSGHWFAISDGHSAFAPYDTRVQVWADLLANPTEEVEDDA